MIPTHALLELVPRQMVHELGENRLAKIHPSLSAISRHAGRSHSRRPFRLKYFQIEKSQTRPYADDSTNVMRPAQIGSRTVVIDDIPCEYGGNGSNNLESQAVPFGQHLTPAPNPRSFDKPVRVEYVSYGYGSKEEQYEERQHQLPQAVPVQIEYYVDRRHW